MLQRLNPRFIRNPFVSRRARFVDAATFIARYRFPMAALNKAAQEMTAQQHAAAIVGLKNYFLAHAHQRVAKSIFRQELAMPSAGVDTLWHAFILCMRDYEEFCTRAFGGMLYHVPAAPSAPRDAVQEVIDAYTTTYDHVIAARLDAYAYVPAHHFAAFGEISALFVDATFATREFPHTPPLETLVAESSHRKSHGHASSFGGGMSPVCVGACESHATDRRTVGCGGGFVAVGDGDGSGGGDGGGSGCGGGCGS